MNPLAGIAFFAMLCGIAWLLCGAIEIARSPAFKRDLERLREHRRRSIAARRH
jgi:uncharacterized membrane protein HdeD (DUF308 family)